MDVWVRVCCVMLAISKCESNAIWYPRGGEPSDFFVHIAASNNRHTSSIASSDVMYPSTPHSIDLDARTPSIHLNRSRLNNRWANLGGQRRWLALARIARIAAAVVVAAAAA